MRWRLRRGWDDQNNNKEKRKRKINPNSPNMNSWIKERWQTKGPEK